MSAIAQKRTEIATVSDLLDKMKGQMAMALPKHITPERMIRVALTAVQNTPKLLECNRNSLLMAVLRSAQLGLEPDGILGQAYLIPYGKNVQLIPGYKGLIDLARRSGEVSNIIAKEVYANDIFEIDFSKEIPFVHKPKLDGERGEVKFFWAMARFKDGGFHWDYLTKKEVEAIRDKGNGKSNAVWKDYFIEMGKKTAIRRIAKYLPMSVQRATVTEDLIDAGKKFSTDDFGEIILEQEDAQDVTLSGNDSLKDSLQKRKAEKEQSAPAFSTSKEELKAEAEKPLITVQVVMVDGQIQEFPNEFNSGQLCQYLQDMMPGDKAEFIRNNNDAFAKILQFMKSENQLVAIETLNRFING